MLRVACVWLILFYPAMAFAGGPLCYTNTGPATWDAAAVIKYKTDRRALRPGSGPNDPGIDSNTAKAMVKDAFAFWSAIGSALIKFKYDSDLAIDITNGPDYSDLQNDASAGNFIVFDQTGQIIDDLYGIGNSRSTLGFAGPVPVGNRIVRFVSVMNGSLARVPAGFVPTMVHEFGHAIGLDHSQIQAGLANDGDPSNDIMVPIMFPTSTDSEDLPVPLLRPLHPDDRAWISKLYPSPAFQSGYGIIRGKVLRVDNKKPVLGANVVAISQVDSEQNRFSCVSDWLRVGSGEFEIPVPPGEYTLLVEPIRPNFYKNSSVGPWAENDKDQSFSSRVKTKQFSQKISVVAGATTAPIKLSVKMQ